MTGPARRRLTRRGAIRAVLGGVLTTGCVGQTGVGDRDDQLSLTVKTLPADSDTAATEIARRLVERLSTVGIDARVQLLPREELRRDVLLDTDFDIYVDRYPARGDPDFLRPLCHSAFDDEIGWQNPFGFGAPLLDEQLDAQRTSAGEQRRDVVADVQRALVRQKPFGTLAFPRDIRAVRSDRFTGWWTFSLDHPLGYVALDHREGRRDGELRLATTNERPTESLNPIGAEYRNRGLFTGLIYDPVGRRYGGAVQPWLAEQWSWRTDETGTVADLHLRPDLAWHDGETLTAGDVAFTYRFLNDTALGALGRPVPAPRFRGRSSLVEAVEVVDERRVRVRFGTTSPAVAARAFTVPVLPRHVWESKATETAVPELDTSATVTEALVWKNQQPVGSGPLRFESRTLDESLTLRRFEDHFLRSGPDRVSEHVAGGPAFERLRVRVAPSDYAGVGLLIAGEADATVTRIRPDTVPRVGTSDSVRLRVSPSRSFYHVGFNARVEPLGDPAVRRAVLSLLDNQRIVDEIFEGYATPAVSPLAGTGWLPTDLEWRGADPQAPFVGEDGELDAPMARDLFREAGLGYEGGALLAP